MPRRFVPRPWISPSIARSLRLAGNGSNGSRGGFHSARLTLTDKSRRRVLVKIPTHLLTKAEVAQRRRVIARLREAGVHLPQTDFAFIPTPLHSKGQWVQVSAWFPAIAKSGQRSPLPIRLALKEQRMEAVREAIKIANAGLIVSENSIVPLASSSRGVILANVEEYFLHASMNRPSPEVVAHHLMVFINYLSRNPTEKARYLALVAQHLHHRYRHASPVFESE